MACDSRPLGRRAAGGSSGATGGTASARSGAWRGGPPRGAGTPTGSWRRAAAAPPRPNACATSAGSAGPSCGPCSPTCSIPRACRPPRRSPCTSAAAGLPPEAISPAKFFPKLAAACHCYALFEVWFLDAQRANRGGGCARPRGSSVGSPASRWMQSPWKRGQVGGGNAASVRRGSTGSGRRMCVVVRRSSN